MNKKRPIFILGFQKCGTTFLHNILQQHSEIALSDVKEPNFFSLKEELIDAHFDDYLSLYKGENFIDSSINYVHDELALKKIHNYFPDCKIIIITRNKIQRFLSAYEHSTNVDGREDYRSLEQVIEDYESIQNNTIDINDEVKLITRCINKGLIKKNYKYFHKNRFGWKIESDFNDPFWHFKYLSNSNYEYHLASVSKIFSSNNVYLLDFKGLTEDTKEIIKDVQKFIGIKYENLSTSVSQHNTKIRKVKFPKWITKVISRVILITLGSNIHKKIKKIYFKPRKEVSDEITKRIDNLFKRCRRF